MAKKFFHLLIVLQFFAIEPARARLEYDSKANKVQLYGPYVKYNVLKEPYSLGRYHFATDEFRLELISPENVNDPELESTPPPKNQLLEDKKETQSPEPSQDSKPEEKKAEATPEKAEPAEKKQEATAPTEEEKQREPQSEQPKKLFVVWPRFLLSSGKVKLITKAKRQLLATGFEEKDLGEDEKYARFELEGEGEDLLEVLKEPFQICLDHAFENSRVKVCSDFYVFKFGQFQPKFSGPNASSALINRKKAPKNAQVSLDKKMKQIRLELKFKSGFYLYIRDKVRHIDLKNIFIDPKERRIGIVSGDGSVRPTELTLKDRFFSFIKENNYYKNQYIASKDWPENLEDEEMEFVPYQTGASIQLFGLILPNVPPDFEFKLNEDNPIATYSRKVELKGTKRKDEVLAAKVTNELFIHEDQSQFLWNFPADKAGAINQNYLSLQHKGRDFYFSKRIFRSNQTSVSAAAALSTSPLLDIVPGYNFNAEHWFEEIWGNSSWSFQRWGLAASTYETIQGFKPNEEYVGKLSVNPTNLDLLFRFSKGVRPVESSFGAGLRFLNFKLFQSIESDLEVRYLGVGAFWHTAPQKIIDDIFNIVPFFRYPKWMELSAFYYPMIIGNQNLGFSFSWQARGKLFFSKSWYLDASFNVNSISFEEPVVRGVTAGFEKFSITTAHGTIGLGYLFN